MDDPLINTPVFHRSSAHNYVAPCVPFSVQTFCYASARSAVLIQSVACSLVPRQRSCNLMPSSRQQTNFLHGFLRGTYEAQAGRVILSLQYLVGKGSEHVVASPEKVKNSVDEMLTKYRRKLPTIS